LPDTSLNTRNIETVIGGAIYCGTVRRWTSAARQKAAFALSGIALVLTLAGFGALP